MKPTQNLIAKVLMLTRSADLEMLENGRIFNKAEKPAARRVAELVRGFDYLACSEFQAACAGKTDAFKNALGRRMSSAEMEVLVGAPSQSLAFLDQAGRLQSEALAKCLAQSAKWLQ